MPTKRTEALLSLLEDLAAFEISLNPYYDDAEPQGVIDNILTGKIDTLRAYCQLFGWSDLVSSLSVMTPLRGNAVTSLEMVQSFVIPEARHLLETTNVETTVSPAEWFWDFVHPRVRTLARPRFEAGFFGDAVEAVFKEVNDAVKRIVKDVDGREIDGAGLMTMAFSVQNPILRLTPLATESDRNVQQGFMQMFAGSMIGIRNPQAHGNVDPSSSTALHLISLAILLLHKVDERL